MFIGLYTLNGDSCVSFTQLPYCLGHHAWYICTDSTLYRMFIVHIYIEIEYIIVCCLYIWILLFYISVTTANSISIPVFIDKENKYIYFCIHFFIYQPTDCCCLGLQKKSTCHHIYSMCTFKIYTVPNRLKLYIKKGIIIYILYV